MSSKPRFLASLALAMAALPSFADSIMIQDAYARAASPAAKSGAAFMVITNHGSQDDRLIAAATDAAARVELHTHIEQANGVFLMREVDGGFEIPAGASHSLARGGDHVMLMGLTGPLEHGDSVSVTLTFENAGEVQIEVPVDLERQDAPTHGAHKPH